ncbi:EAL domain-containing protein [Undibacterium sp. Di24W]|uniref:EAL domain-containing protein n=1 Tax=Undibacterium sp. Di24W TaxID=3413033 RepID=UPI003BF1D471
MTYVGLNHYLDGLQTSSASNLFVGKEGRVTARFFNARLSSVFQPIRSGNNLELLGYEAFVRTVSVNDMGLNILKLLEHATTDDESVELDRLCRLLHAINFFRQAPIQTSDLYLSVHNRLLTAVTGNHGAAFQRVLSKLDIPQQRIVLQLPAISASQRWAISHVAENYRRNGFRFAVHAGSIEQAFDLLERVRPNVLKLNFGSHILDKDGCLFEDLLVHAARLKCLIVLRKVDRLDLLDKFQKFSDFQIAFAAQGNAIDIPRSVIAPSLVNSASQTLRINTSDMHRQECCN